MSIPAGAKANPLSSVSSIMPLTDRNGQPTVQAQGTLEQLRGYINGGGRVFACLAGGTNVISLTPNGHDDEEGVSPTLSGYLFGDAFLFYAANTSTGSVTMTVVPMTGVLGTLKAYKSNGATQAGSGDVVANSLYIAYYVPILDSNAGGFVLK